MLDADEDRLGGAIVGAAWPEEQTNRERSVRKMDDRCRADVDDDDGGGVDDRPLKSHREDERVHSTLDRVTTSFSFSSPFFD